jgi:ribosomal protein S18 acetylase RimI-like enzyme
MLFVGSVLHELLSGDDVLALRPADATDAEFLNAVYASTRQEELAPVPWSAADKEAFLRQQFAAQDAYYRQHWPNTEFLVILDGGEPIGRLYVCESADQLIVMDIALLPEHRGRGIGTRLVEALLERAKAHAVPVTLHVEANNPAQRLYARLGFVDVGEEGVYRELEWSAPAETAC